MMDFNIEDLKFDEKGLVPAIVQDVHSGRVLMLAHMTLEALKKTVLTGETHFWSRSRQEIWHKGESSGSTQTVRRISLDCDGDALLIQVEQKGNACHTGNFSCFFRSTVEEYQNVEGFAEVIAGLARRIHQRKVERPKDSYTTYLFDAGMDKILKKVGEEAGEIIIAAKNKDRKEIAWEAADLVYHLLVMLEVAGVSLSAVSGELSRRAHRKGNEQKHAGAGERDRAT